MGGRAWSTICLALWLLGQGMIAVFHLSFDAITITLGVLAILTAILLFMGK